MCWAITALMFESAGRRLGSMVVNQLRLVMAVFFLAAFCAIYRGLPLPTDAGAHQWIWLTLSGWLGFNFGDLCLFRAFVVLGSRLSVLMMSLVPPITALLGWAVLGETLRPMDLLGMAMTVSGVIWVVLERPKQPHALHPSVSGILLGLGGALGQAGGLVLSKLGMGDYDPFAATQIRIFAGIFGFLIVFTASRWWPRVPRALRDRRGVGYTAVGAFFGPFVGVSLSLLAIQLAKTGVAATIMSLTPVLILPLTIYFRGQHVSARAAFGAIMAVAGTAVLFLT
jgi:drug/metabolite transporter (DMT)-like permease